IGGSPNDAGNLISSPHRSHPVGLSLFPNGVEHHPASGPRACPTPSRACPPAPEPGRYLARAGGENLPNFQQTPVVGFAVHQTPAPAAPVLWQTRGAHGPHEQQAGYGPRLTALIGELGGMHRTSRRLIQDFCRSVLHLPISLGAVQKLIDRTSQALVPHYEAIATLARQSTVGYIDETPWYCHNALHWLWTLTTDTVSLYLIHPHRSKDAFFALIEAWQGIL